VADEARKKKKKQRMKAIYGFMILRNEKGVSTKLS
jgi:hypothetical protein